MSDTINDLEEIIELSDEGLAHISEYDKETEALFLEIGKVAKEAKEELE